MGLITIMKCNITCDKCGNFYSEEDFEGDPEQLIEYAKEDGWHIVTPGDNYNSATIYCDECAEDDE